MGQDGIGAMGGKALVRCGMGNEILIGKEIESSSMRTNGSETPVNASTNANGTGFLDEETIDGVNKRQSRRLAL